ncbi:MAG: biopolymer transporter ExbD [Desulfosarcinaceae bacterium]|nr:biopolymer transporter ExbD [Desulfosarcinaceae bacterium]
MDDEINMVPIMNMFMVLIPFLLMSASFFHIKAINTSVPVLAEGSQEDHAEKQISVTVVVKLRIDGINTSSLSNDLSKKELADLEGDFSFDAGNEKAYAAFSEHLMKVKKRYPKSDTLIIIPAEDIIYDTIIQTMDVARKTDEDTLFPNVVLSASLG